MIKAKLRTRRGLYFALCIFHFSFSTDARGQADLSPFLKQHCFDCHSGDAPQGGLNLETRSTDLANAQVRLDLIHLYDRVAGGEMPPKTADRPDEASRAGFLKSLGDSLRHADLAAREFVLRRLNRNEYQNTVRDLFGIHVDVTRLLPADSADNQFDTIGSSLSLSAQQMALYVEAADLVLDEVFGPATEPKRIHKTGNFKDVRAVGDSDRKLDEGIVLFNFRALPMYGVSVPTPGTYRLRVEVKPVQTESTLFVRIDGGVTGRLPSHVAAFFEAPAGKVTTIEVTDRAVERSDTFAVSLVDGFPWWKVDSATYKGPGLFLGNYELEGPLEEWPRASVKRLLGDVDPKVGTLDDVRAILMKILPRAVRRPVAESEAGLYIALAKQAIDDGLSFEKALRRGLKGVICAPDFLFMEESTDKATGTINDFALASRLSYFLWSSMPDDELLAVAGRNQLRDARVLRTQVERMLHDPKSERFVENYTGQWLKLRHIDFTVPDQLIYPEYDRLLRRSMVDETHAFFREILRKDLSVQNFIDSDFVMINQPLAEFYGIDGVKGLKIRRVELPDDSVRGGVMTHGSVLKVSADGTSTSPVLRGVWILKNLYGTPPKPRPSSVEAIEPDIRGATTIREQLAKHREHTSCNRCHRFIDPAGFALESFDVIGGWRTWYRTRQNGKYLKTLLHPQAPRQTVRYRQGLNVDSTGVLPDGRKFADIREYKQLLLDDETAMPRSLARLLLTYSLGREPGFSDRPEVESIVSISGANNYGLRSLIHEVVQSDAFRRP